MFMYLTWKYSNTAATFNYAKTGSNAIIIEHTSPSIHTKLQNTAQKHNEQLR